MLSMLDALKGSLSLQIEAVLALLRDDNVDVMIDAMPPDFRVRFIDWMRSKYRGGPTVTIGPSSGPVPTVGILAMQQWLDRHRDTAPSTTR
jgi:hypothetical protein